MYQYGNFIGGTWSDAGGPRFSTFDPARPTRAVGEYVAAGAEDVAEAVGLAATAQATWARIPPVERARVTSRFLDQAEAAAEAIAEAIAREQGKPLSEAEGECGKALREARFMVGNGLHGHGDVVAPQRPGVQNLVLRRPRGVIAAITPWNFPVLTPMRKIVPALVYGNAILLKPSEFTPATACLLADAAAGILPEGLLQILNGGANTGDALVSQPGVHGVTFTGSVATGRAIYRSAAANLAELSLELGGKNAVVINDSDDLDGCLDQVVNAAFQCAGQRCTAISRVIVAAELEEAVIAGLVKRAGAAKLGDGMASDTTMGPLINRQQLEHVETLVHRGVEEGATVHIGGRPASVDGLAEGHFYEPTILGGVRSRMAVAREEIFGPVISVLAYRGFDEAMRILNDVDYGLTSALFSNDNTLVQRFLTESDNGMMHVNHGTVPDDHMPFGGIKNSGVGAYSVGGSVQMFYTTEHSAYVKYA